MNKSIAIEMEPITELINLKKCDIDSVCDRLLYEYFYPITPHASRDKKFIMEQYNTVAREINERAGFKRVITLTPSTVVEFIFESPAMGKIYVDIKPAVVHADNKPSIPTIKKTIAGTVITTGKTKIAHYSNGSGKPRSVKLTVKPEPSNVVSIVGGIGGSKTDQIVSLFEAGHTQQQIIDAGYNRNTVVPVLWKHKKSLQSHK